MANRINLSPLHWGPKTWFFLESVGIAYPESPNEEQKTAAKNMLLSLKELLPCETCRINYGNYLGETVDGNYLDEVVKNRDALITFIVNVHNDVRVRNGQKALSMEDVFNYYQNEYRKKPESQYDTTVNSNNKIQSRDEIIKSMSLDNSSKEHYSNITSDLLFHFNPITLLIGVMLGLIIFKFYSDSVCDKNRS